MSIDIEAELRRMSKEFGLSEKEVCTSFRADVRNLWGKSIFKKTIYNSSVIKVKNDNPRSMKRFPYVKKHKCSLCGEYFTAPETELDHLESENTMTKFEHAESFIQTIFFTSPTKLQILCKDKKKKVKGKSQVVRFGCHAIRTYSERYGVSFEQAKAEKTALELIKQKLDKEWLIDNGVTPESTQVKRREQIVEILMRNGGVTP